MNLVFMLEEPSMKFFLDGFIRKIFPDEFQITYLVHEGKQDLEKSIPRKLKAWQIPNTRFIIVRDKDGEEPLVLKARLRSLCASRPDSLIRIAVHHLESWVLGDMAAVSIAFKKPNLAALSANRKFRNPDNLANASQEISRLISGYQKVQGARAVSPHLDFDANLSPSFNLFVRDLKAIAAAAEV